MIIILFIMISSCFASANHPDRQTVSGDLTTAEPEPDVNISNNQIAVLETNYGVIKFALYEERAPITSENFIKLADERFYDGIKFHRIIDDFVIQTGDPNTRDDNPYNDGNGGSDETIPLEIHPELTHIDGAVGMARSSDPDSASSQFYICDKDQHGLDGDYAVFGLTIEGMEVVREIAQAETYPNYRVALKDHPVDDIVMLRVFIEQPLNITSTTDILDESEINNDTGGGLPGFQGATTIIAITAVFVLISSQRKRNI